MNNAENTKENNFVPKTGELVWNFDPDEGVKIPVLVIRKATIEDIDQHLAEVGEQLKITSPFEEIDPRYLEDFRKQDLFLCIEGEQNTLIWSKYLVGLVDDTHLGNYPSEPSSAPSSSTS